MKGVETLYVTPTVYPSVFNTQVVLVAQKRRSRALPSTGAEVDSFPVYGEHNLLVLSALYQEACAYHVPCTVNGRLFGLWNKGTRNSFDSTKHGAVFVVPFAS